MKIKQMCLETAVFLFSEANQQRPYKCFTVMYTITGQSTELITRKVITDSDLEDTCKREPCEIANKLCNS